MIWIGTFVFRKVSNAKSVSFTNEEHGDCSIGITSLLENKASDVIPCILSYLISTFREVIGLLLTNFNCGCYVLDCCMNISLAISNGFVRILLLLSSILSNGGFSLC